MTVFIGKIQLVRSEISTENAGLDLLTGSDAEALRLRDKLSRRMRFPRVKNCSIKMMKTNSEWKFNVSHN